MHGPDHGLDAKRPSDLLPQLKSYLNRAVYKMSARALRSFRIHDAVSTAFGFTDATSLLCLGGSQTHTSNLNSIWGHNADNPDPKANDGELALHKLVRTSETIGCFRRIQQALHPLTRGHILSILDMSNSSCSTPPPH